MGGTLLILGAGASRPYFFPTSTELRKLILGAAKYRDILTETLAVDADKVREFIVASGRFYTPNFNRDPQLLAPDWRTKVNLPGLALDQAFDQLGRLSELEGFKARFFDSGRMSIDAFVQRCGYKEQASIAVAFFLLMCEREELLDGDWYQQLLEAIMQAPDRFLEHPFRVLNFNYDRSFERFFRRTIKEAFRDDRKTRDALITALTPNYVYGNLGSLEEGNAITYGSLSAIKDAARTLDFCRARSGGETLLSGETLVNISKVIFLGFSFWPENVERLGLETLNGRKVFSTAYQMPKSVMEFVKRRVDNIYFGARDHTALDFIREEGLFDFGA